MWCLICKISFTEHELFKCHILEKHKPDYEFYKDSDTDKEELEQESLSEASDTEMHNEDSTEIYNEDSIEMHNEDSTETNDDSTGSSEDATQLSFDLSSYESPSKSSNSFSSKNPLTYGLRRSNRLKTSPPKSKTFSSEINVYANKKKKFKRANNTKSAAKKNNDNSVVTQAVVHQPAFVYPFNSNVSQMNINGGFELNSKNIHEWLTELNNLCKTVTYPLPPHLYDKIQLIHKGLITLYSMAPPKEENNAILKVFENLNKMILKHIESINNLL